MSPLPSAGIINGIRIDDTFAEAVDMAATGVIVTAPAARLAAIAAQGLTGFAASIEGCGIEAGIDRELAPEETPDGRPGFRVLLFAGDVQDLKGQLARRVGHCVMPVPGSAVYAGMAGGPPVPLGNALRNFGDGHQISKRLNRHRYWRVPVLDGEFLVEDATGSTHEAIGGAGLVILARGHDEALAAAESAAEAALSVPGVILPSPGGMQRAGVKAGSVYAARAFSTRTAFCPTLRGQPGSLLDDDTEAVIEVAMNGLGGEVVREAMKRAIQAVLSFGAQRGIQRISAAGTGAATGRHRFELKELIR